MEPSPAVDEPDEVVSLGGDPPDARARKAGGLYLACCIWVSCANLWGGEVDGKAKCDGR